jgi:hypothetical protein
MPVPRRFRRQDGQDRRSHRVLFKQDRFPKKIYFLKKMLLRYFLERRAL